MEESKYCPICKMRLIRKAGRRQYCPECMIYFNIQVHAFDADSPLLKKEK